MGRSKNEQDSQASEEGRGNAFQGSGVAPPTLCCGADDQGGHRPGELAAHLRVPSGRTLRYRSRGPRGESETRRGGSDPRLANAGAEAAAADQKDHWRSVERRPRSGGTRFNSLNLTMDIRTKGPKRPAGARDDASRAPASARCILRIYVSGTTPSSTRALVNIRRI